MENFEPIEEQGFEVWIKTNENNFIVEVNSNLFINNYVGWIKIDDHVLGNKGARAQVSFFDKPLITHNGQYNYKYVNGKIEENK